MKQVIDLLPGKLVVDMVVEAHSDHRQTEERGGANVGFLLHRVHGDLDGDSDKLFYLLSRASRPLRDNGHLGIGDIGKSVDRCLAKAHYTHDDHGEGYDENKILALERESDNEIDELIHCQAC